MRAVDVECSCTRVYPCELAADLRRELDHLPVGLEKCYGGITGLFNRPGENKKRQSVGYS